MSFSQMGDNVANKGLRGEGEQSKFSKKIPLVGIETRTFSYLL